jgi:hypothetical protein
MPKPRSIDPVCPCQWGICGACDGENNAYGQARHDRCATRQHLKHYGRPAVIHSSVVNHKGFAVARLLTGCRYMCPCGCINDPALAAAPPRRLALPKPVPAVVAYVLDEYHPALFDLETESSLENV